jgi:predicted metalloprotease
LVAGCSTVVQGNATSPLFDPFHVAGLPVADGPSGVRENAPEPTGTVANTDGGEVDRIATLAVNDVADFWKSAYGPSFGGTFTPIDKMASYDSTDPDGPSVCGHPTFHFPNAFYCFEAKGMAWDRGVLVPTGIKYFGEVAVAGLIGHEYGHAVQKMAGLTDDNTPVVVAEQQADCFGGSYLRWVAEGKSPRFQLSTGDGLNHVLAGMITGRDPLTGRADRDLAKDGHGSALDRITAFQMGFTSGPTRCAHIDYDDVKARRSDLPTELAVPRGDDRPQEPPVDEATLSTLMKVLGVVFSPAQPPTLSYDKPDCGDSAVSPGASYCAANNTIYVDLPGLQQLGERANESNGVLLQGSNTALSVVVARYAQAVQRERGLVLESGTAAMRTACLTGVAEKGLAKPVDVPDSDQLVLNSAGLDEAVAGLLTNGLAASTPSGATVPGGFTRIVAFRAGLAGDAPGCYQRFA